MLHIDETSSPDQVTLAPGISLARGRAHELTGPSRHFLALLAGAALRGPILWLRPGWVPGGLMGDGICSLVEPGRLVFGTARGASELLQAAELALRGGLIPLVIVESPVLPDLTAVRRLHLAAQPETGAGNPPLMLLLSPEKGGAPGVETRWHIAPMPGWAKDGCPRWRLFRLRARTAPEKSWELRQEQGRVHIVSGDPGPEFC